MIPDTPARAWARAGQEARAVRLVVAASALLGLAGGQAVAQDTKADAKGNTAANNTAAKAPPYHIGPMDTLQITVWKEPELTREVPVRLDGAITFPLLGDVAAAGQTPSQLAEAISKGLQRYVETPRVTVAIAQANSARFYVVGLVNKSGEFPLSGRTTILQGLALAGGFKEFAKTERIVIVRANQAVVPINYKMIAEGKDVSQNVTLSPGDTIVVP
jgi:polysaccharide export outer membrane protein